jgi:hypothetical protein
MPSLKRLHLGWCDIEDDRLVVLVAALEQNSCFQILYSIFTYTLQEIYVFGTHLGSIVVYCLATGTSSPNACLIMCTI